MNHINLSSGSRIQNPAWKLLLSMILFGLLTTLPGWTQRSWYVDPLNGCDTNNGLATNSAFLTISRAMNGATNAAAPGDTVYLRGGVYRPQSSNWLVAQFNVTATEDAPITLAAYSYTYPATNYTTNVSGGVTNIYTNGYTFYGTERPILKCSLVAQGPWTLVSDSEIASIGFPTNGSGYIYKYTNWMCDTNGKVILSNHSSIVSNPQQVFMTDSETNDGVCLQQMSWPNSSNTLAPWDIGDVETSGDYCGPNGSPTNLCPGSFYYVQTQNATNVPDVSTIYVWLPDGSNPTNHVMEVSVAQGFFGGANNYLHYSNLTFRHSNTGGWGPGAVSALGVGIGGSIDSCDIQWLDGFGVWVGGSITRSKICNIGRQGVSLGAGAVLDTCYIAQCNYRDFSQGGMCGGIKEVRGCSGVIIQNCEFATNYGPAIWFDNVNAGETNAAPPIIRHNFIHHCKGLGVYNAGYQDVHTSAVVYEVSDNIYFYNNLLMNNHGHAMRIGGQDNQFYDNIFLDNNNDDNQSPGNFGINFTAGGGAGFDITNFVNNQIFNNIFCNNSNGVVLGVQTNIAVNDYTNAFGNLCDYNIYWSDAYPASSSALLFGNSYIEDAVDFPTWQQTSGYDLHSLVMNPQLAGPFDMQFALGDFRALFDGITRNNSLSLNASNEVFLPGGGLNVPTLTFSNDPTTGIYDYSYGTLGISGNANVSGNLTVQSIVTSVNNGVAVNESGVYPTTGGDYVIDFAGDGMEDLQASAYTLTFTTTNLWPGVKKTLFLNSGAGWHNLSWPSSWIWMGAGSPLVLSNNTLAMVKLTSRSTNDAMVVAEWQSGPYLAALDTNASAFITAAGITNGFEIGAVNQLCVDLKAHGLWSKLLAFYPFVGSSATAHSQNLISSNYPITWHGTVTHDYNGITGDGSTGYGDTGLVPATALASLNSSMIFAWNRTAVPNNESYPFGCKDTNSMRWGVYFDLSWGGLHQHGLNNNTMGVFGIKPVTNYAGGLAINRYASTNEAVYCNITNSVFSGGDSIAVALPNASLYFDARNTPTGTDGFSTANLSAGAIGQNFVDADIKQLMTDVGNFEANLNR